MRLDGLIFKSSEKQNNIICCIGFFGMEGGSCDEVRGSTVMDARLIYVRMSALIVQATYIMAKPVLSADN